MKVEEGNMCMGIEVIESYVLSTSSATREATHRSTEEDGEGGSLVSARSGVVEIGGEVVQISNQRGECAVDVAPCSGPSDGVEQIGRPGS